MSFLLEYLRFSFVQRAFVAGLIIALIGAMVGFFVVLRRMAFVATGVAHAALGGVAVGVLLHQSPLLWAVVAAVLVALAMSSLARRGVHEDTAMGIFYPAAMAFGVLVISFTKNWQTDLLAYLFGNILGVSQGDLWVLGVVGIVCAVVIGVFFKELLFISFDEESAHAAGVPVAAMRTMLLVLTAVTVVVSIKAVGVVLVSAVLVIPAATAGQLTSRWQWTLVLSMVVAVIALWTGMIISFKHDVAPGPTAVLVATVMFAVAGLIARPLRERTHRLAAAAVAESEPEELPVVNVGS